MSITISESCAISFVRFLAMCSIVTCHLLQVQHNRYCWLFNIGVQVFLAISGYLYGCKKIDKWKEWFKSRFVKLYIPYALFLIVCTPIYFLFAPDNINIKLIIIHLLDLQGILGYGINGLGHLWFMSVIALCYLITPLLQRIRKYQLLIIVGLLLGLFLNLYSLRFFVNLLSCLFIYCVCYLFAGMEKDMKKYVMFVLGIMFIWSAVSISWDNILDYTNPLNQMLHITVGLLIVMSVTYTYKYKYLQFPIYGKFLKIIDVFSYDIYITHHIFILGPFSLIMVTPFTLLNVTIILAVTCFSALLLHKLSIRITYLMQKI